MKLSGERNITFIIFVGEGKRGDAQEPSLGNHRERSAHKCIVVAEKNEGAEMTEINSLARYQRVLKLTAPHLSVARQEETTG